MKNFYPFTLFFLNLILLAVISVIFPMAKRIFISKNLLSVTDRNQHSWFTIKNIKTLKLPKCVIIGLLLLMAGVGSMSGTTRTWAGGTGTGKNWTTGSNWSPSGAPAAGDDVFFNTAGTITFSTLPTSIFTYNSLTINLGTVILAGTTRTFTLGGNTGVDFIVASGATLTTTNVNITLATSATATIAGTYNNPTGITFNTNGTSVVTTVTGTIVNAGTITNSTASKLLFQSASTYTHAQDGGTIPTATWNAASNCNITGIVAATAIAGLGQTFGNFTWNCAGQTSNLYMQSNLTVAGNFSVLGTGTADTNNHTLRLSSTATGYTIAVTGNVLIDTNATFKLNNGAGSCTMNIGGNLTLNSGIFTIVTGLANSTVNVTGDVIISGGTLDMNENDAVSIGTLNVKGDFTFSSGIIYTDTSGWDGAINFNGNTTQVYSKTGGTISSTINFAVISGSTLDVGTSLIDGSAGTFTLNSGAGIITAHTQGLSTSTSTGSIQVTGIITYSTGANYTYDGTVAQVTGNGLTQNTPANLTINSTNTVTLSAATTITGNLLISQGTLSTSTSNFNMNVGGNWTNNGAFTPGTGTVTMNGAAQSIGGTVSTKFNNLTLSGSGTKTLGIATSANGAFTISSGVTLATANYQLTFGGNFANNGTALNAGSSPIIIAGTANQNIAGFTTTGTISITKTAGTATFTGNVNGAEFTMISTGTLNLGTALTHTFTGTITMSNGTLQGNSSTLNINGNINATGGAWDPGTGTVNYGGAAAQTVMGSTTYYNLTISGGSAKTLQGAVTVSHIVTLTSGILTTTGTNSLSITNTATAAISGGSTTSFINGPVIWTLPAGLVSGSTYNFPVGKGTTYLPFALVNPTTGTVTVTAQVEAFTGNSVGTSDATLSSISNTEYWSLVPSVNFTTCSVSLTRQTALTPLNVIAGSTALTGSYTSLGGTAGTYGVSNSNVIGSNRYFLLAQNFIPQTISTGSISGSPFCNGSSVSVPYTIVGTYTAGNIFTAQLSNASSSFTSPVNIGTLTSTTAGTISATIPANTTTGTGYRIRVISSTPAKIGTDNGTNLTINAISTALTTTGGMICIGGSTAVLSASGAVTGEKYKWYDAVTGGNLLKTSTDNTDNIYTTPTLSATTNYWVSILNASGCESARVQVTATYPDLSSDNQSLAGTDSWIGHVYEGTNSAVAYNGNFTNYFGHYTEPEIFNENFGGDQVCFGITSNSTTRSIYTETFSVRYRMNSIRDGLYVVNLGSDDGNRLTVDGTLIYNDWNDHSISSRPTVLMSLTGSSSLVYDFYENGGQNQVYFQNLTQILANNLTTNTIQTIPVGNSGTAISGDVFGTLPTGITLSGTGYQWTYSTTPTGTRTNITGATGATYTPNASIAPFNTIGTYYIYRNAILSSTNNVAPNPYVATNESNAATIKIAKNYWIGKISTNWGDARNWTAGQVPVAGVDVEYATATNYKADSSAVRDLYVDATRTIGNLINATTKRLVIPAATFLTVNNNITVTPPVTTPVTDPASLIYISSSSTTPNGSLIFHNPQNSPVYGTVEMVAIGSYSATGATYGGNTYHYSWQFFGIPVSSVVANPTFYGSYVRRWVESGNLVTNHWVDLTNSSVLAPFSGYELTQTNPTTILFQGQLLNSDWTSPQLAKTAAALYPGQWILGNSFASAVDITKISFGTDMIASVWLYTTGSFADWGNAGGAGATGGKLSGQYEVSTPSTAGIGGVAAQIPSMQGFLVQVNTASANATVSIPYSAIVNNAASQRVKAQADSTTTDKVYTRIDVNGATYSDKMWLFTNSACSRKFDNGWDGSKMFGSALTPQIFAVEPDGNYQIDAVDDINNTKIGFHPGVDTEYTLTFTHQNVEGKYSGIYLIDLVEDKITDITKSESKYTFMADTTTTYTNRFQIIANKVEQDSISTLSKIKVFNTNRKFFVQNLSDEKGEFSLFDVSGRYLFKSYFDANSVSETGSVKQPGIYIVRATTNSEKVTTRLIVR
jgi:hypothetical protein